MAAEVHRKIALLGFRGVGKSSLVRQLAEGRFQEEYEPTLINTAHVPFRVGSVSFLLEVLETAGQDEFSAIPKEASIGVHGYVLVFSVESRSSFDKLRLINDTLLNAIGVDTIPRVLVGNKTDLSREGRREVSEAEGAALAAKWGCAYLETSALMNDGVADVFEKLLRRIEAGSGLLEEKDNGMCTIL